MGNQETIALRVFHPKQQAPTALQNTMLEEFIREIVGQSSLADLRMRFFGIPDIEAIAGRITGRIVDSYEQPRDIVIVAFENQRPVAYTDIARFSQQPGTAEISMLVRSDRQRRGIGKAMLQQVVCELRAEGVKQIESYIHPENSKMKRALQKWGQAQELQDVQFRKSFREGEIVYRLGLEAKNTQEMASHPL
jgi:RimJ/RimL family protein N-acetyltransferase